MNSYKLLHGVSWNSINQITASYHGDFHYHKLAYAFFVYMESTKITCGIERPKHGMAKRKNDKKAYITMNY